MTITTESRKQVRYLARVALLLALTLAIQSLRMPVFITGSMINLMLVISTALAGTTGGVVIGSFTPMIALLAGILPAPLAPAVPFIMAGNAFYCLIFGAGYFRSRAGAWTGLFAGSVIKFSIIAGAARYILALPSPLTEVLFFPQFMNAMAGGTAALLIIPQIHKKIRS